MNAERTGVQRDILCHDGRKQLGTVQLMRRCIANCSIAVGRRYGVSEQSLLQFWPAERPS